MLIRSFRALGAHEQVVVADIAEHQAMGLSDLQILGKKFHSRRVEVAAWLFLYRYSAWTVEPASERVTIGASRHWFISIKRRDRWRAGVKRGVADDYGRLVDSEAGASK